MANHLIVLAALLIGGPSPGASSSSGTMAPRPDQTALDQAVHDMCPKSVAMLGEATHGDGATVAFKVALVRQLVEKCHFNAVFFEASHYDFLDFSRRLRAGEPTSPEMISAAVGGLWKFDREFASLAPYLYGQAASGKIVVGGFDDQIGAAGSLYQFDALPDELTRRLDAPRRQACRDILRQRTAYQFAHYGSAEHQLVSQCANEIDATLSNPGGPAAERAVQREMVASIKRALARELETGPAYIQGRDHSMYLNFRWLAKRLPPHSKIILWGATFHFAKDSSTDAGYTLDGNFGSFVHRDYGRRAFALGFSALGGAFRYSRSDPARSIPPADAGSLEGRAYAGIGADAVYLGQARLSAMGEVPGRLDRYVYITRPWAHVVDGVIVLRQQFPPQRTDGS